MDIIKILLQVQPENRPNCGIKIIQIYLKQNLDQILKHPIILKKLETFKCTDENEESSLLQTIRIPKNLLFLTDKLPQPNYEKKIVKKNNNNSNSFSDEIKESLPDIKTNNNKNNIRKRSENKFDSEKKENSEDKRTNERNSLLINYLPTQNTNDDKHSNNIKLSNEQIIIPKKKRRIDNNDRSLDNIISHNIYSNALNGSGIGSNNIKILKSENYEIHNSNSMLRDKSPYEDSPYLRKKNKDIMMLPNIRHQQKYEIKYLSILFKF